MEDKEKSVEVFLIVGAPLHYLADTQCESGKFGFGGFLKGRDEALPRLYVDGWINQKFCRYKDCDIIKISDQKSIETSQEIMI